MDNLTKVLKKWHEISEKLENIEEVIKYYGQDYQTFLTLRSVGLNTEVEFDLSPEEVLEMLYKQEEELRNEYNKIEKSLEGATKIAKELVGE